MILTWRTIPTTTWTWRPSIARTNTIEPIITGLWDDLATWTETWKFWNDAGDGAWTTWTWRTIPA